WIEGEDVRAVAEILRADWITTGPRVPAFEAAVARFVGAREGVAVSSGTAALHAAIHASGVGEGDEVVVPAMTFASSANAVVFERGTPVFADVDPRTLLLDPADVERRLTPRTRAVMAVDYAGQPCDYEVLRQICRGHDLTLIADACHALGATYRGQRVGTLADFTAFSFHPVKHITTGEGGMVMTDSSEHATRMRSFRNHGISSEARARERQAAWHYEMVELGYNYRLTDFQCALGMSQLTRLEDWLARRQALAAQYDQSLADLDGVTPLTVREDVEHAYHLYVVRVDGGGKGRRDAAFHAMRVRGIGVNVHYIPVHLHPFYRERFGTGEGQLPVCEQAYEEILTLPLFPRMSEADVDKVVTSLREALEAL
ncbi:MAG: UDP-4-amino-4,6-dideoxy-N-acetyl-beta-L-altrosamine transaminase, partial [candidate division NC10 bacterium]